ncbi:hypothetical protein FKX85_15020 [Echinicola soli]|uniref:Uncharacterized protein n=1 Tax=Echinicola soli TaxID=2591634 RepID=A0A514CKA8_9BACT|nr:hypothetical protein [Echinicola soli]QDH80275.1 hypothetical protein FKX85_15020 [Echinicola soli]
MKPFKIFMLLLTSFWITSASFAQGVNKSDNPYYKPYFDSLQNMDWPYKLPILGKQAYKRGYDIPYAYGISGIYFTQTQEITIQSIQLGFNGGNQVDFSEFITFGPTIAATNAYTIRPDIWVLPFLNVYGMIGGGTTDTNVSLLKPIGLQTDQHFSASSFGLGATLSGAVGPFWIAWDNNYNFVDVDVVVEPIPAFNSSLRVGHSILNPTNPEKALSVWAGVFYQSISNDTRGSISVKEIFPQAGEGILIDYMHEWASTLPPPQRVIANQIIDKIEDISNGTDPGNATIDYVLDKKVTSPFNILLGAQYQFNKNIMLRSELGVFGRRSQFLLNLNYRFPGFKKNPNK